MEQKIKGCKAEDVAVLPFAMNLQLFSEGDEVDSHTDPSEPDDVVWEPFDSDKPHDEPEQVEKPEVVEPEPEKPKQDHETNKAFQEMRRSREEAERTLRENDAWAKENFGHLGVNSMAEYKQYLVDERKREEYERQGIDYDEVRKIAQEEAANHPDVIRSRQIEQKYQVNREIHELKSAFPDVPVGEISDLRDLQSELEKLPNWEQISDRVRRGYSLKEAYELANQNEIMQKRIAAAEQAARNKIAGKQHMKPNGSAEADESISVPDDVMRDYERIFAKQLKNKTMTREDFVKHYKRSVKG